LLHLTPIPSASPPPPTNNEHAQNDKAKTRPPVVVYKSDEYKPEQEQEQVNEDEV
jgi:hypothetical protein